MISQFYLKSPLTDLHVLLDRYVHELVTGEFAGFRCKRFLHVPVSEVIAEDAKLRMIQQGIAADGIKFGKIALLMTDHIDYRPLGALVISDAGERYDVSESAVAALTHCNIRTSLVTKDNFREQTRALLTSCKNRPNLVSESADVANRYERRAFKEILANVPLDFLKSFQESWGPMLQIGMMGVIDAVQFGDNYQPSRQERNITSVAEFDALSKTPHGRQIRNHILNDFRCRSSFDLIFVGKESICEKGHDPSKPFWWPRLAIEIDGPHHANAKNVLSDHKKDTLCLLAGLPLLRVNLPMMDSTATQTPQPGIWTIDESTKAHWDYFRFMLLKSMRSFGQFKKRQIEGDREMKLWLNIKFFVDGGMDVDAAISKALDDDFHEHEAEDREDMVDHQVEDWEKQDRRARDIERYHERFGMEPVPKVHIDEHDVLHGCLGNHKLPPLRSFCRIADHSDINTLRVEFAEDWLLRRAIE